MPSGGHVGPGRHRSRIKEVADDHADRDRRGALYPLALVDEGLLYPNDGAKCSGLTWHGADPGQGAAIAGREVWILCGRAYRRCGVNR